MPECSRLALEAVANGMCVVIGLQSTGEANTTAQREKTRDDFDDYVSVRGDLTAPYGSLLRQMYTLIPRSAKRKPMQENRAREMYRFGRISRMSDLVVFRALKGSSV